MGKIVKAKDGNGNVVYPITIGEAVIINDGTAQKTLKQKLGEIEGAAGVTGVKGNSETAYRTGQVNITKANIGLGNVENTALSTWAGSANLTTAKVGTLANAATKTAGSAVGNVPVVGTALGTTANVPVVTDASGNLKPHASGALGTAAFTASTAYLASGTKYAGASTAGGAATSANKVNKALTIGGKTFDGSAAVEVTAADLGIAGATHFAGVSTTDPKGTSGATVSGYTTWGKGDIVLYGNKEYILNGTTNSKDNWVELGDESAYAVKATTLAGYGITDAYTKTETGTQITNAINALDGNLNSTSPGSGKTLTAFSQTDGKVSATFGNISITKSQVSDFPSKLPASDVTDTYSPTGKVPVSGTAVASAISGKADATTTLAGYGITDGVVANAAITGATKCKITYDSKGLVTKGENLAAADIPSLAASKITSGTFADARIASAATWNAKQDALTFDGTYNASTNKAATVKTVTDAVATAMFFDTKIDGTNEIMVSNDDAIMAAVIAAVAS